MSPTARPNDPIAYPALKRSDIDRLIGVLIGGGPAISALDPLSQDGQLLSYLLSFHTKRWGLPKSVRGSSAYEG